MFTAMHRSEVLYRLDSLPALLEELALDVDVTVPEAVAVWHAGLVVCVVQPDGSVVWVLPQFREADEGMPAEVAPAA